jgi:hypothetical protein
MVFFGVLKKLAAKEDNPDSHYVYNLLLAKPWWHN